MSAPWMKKALANLAFFAFAALAAVGFGMYVYPVNPILVWALLFFCWACYRLRLRAIALFGGSNGRSDGRAPVRR